MISFIVPTYNSERTILLCIDAILKQSMPFDELIVVDDHSTDSTLALVGALSKKNKKIRVIKKPHSGIAATTNEGIRKAKGSIVCLIDSDAIIEKNWLETVSKELKGDVGVVAGYIKTANPDKFWARITGYDLEYRYSQISAKFVDHVSPCNTAYRKEVFGHAGFFDEDFGYGQDVDFSYRVLQKGYRIILLKTTGCMHYWKETFWGFMKQQYNVAYGRMDILRKHRDKMSGDRVSNFWMFVQVPLTTLFILSAITSIPLYLFYHHAVLLYPPAAILLILFLTNLQTTFWALQQKRDYSSLAMPITYILRNIAWVAAFVGWGLRNVSSALSK